MKIIARDQDGNRHELEALEGWSAMEIIRDHNLPIKAECGGACCCATCHVYVEPEWLPKLMPPSPEEQDLLNDSFDQKENSRLSCQILMREDLDGLEVTLANSAKP
ncbi:MAG TPA: 2Fe-2S iron-sulfur cluster-binding protein [Alphaproteobacteria bacterium]